MFEGITPEEETKLLMELPPLTDTDRKALIEIVEELMTRAFRDGVNAGR